MVDRTTSARRIRQHIADGRLIVVLDEFTKSTGFFRALLPSNPFVAPKVRAFVDVLAEISPSPAH